MTPILLVARHTTALGAEYWDHRITFGCACRKRLQQDGRLYGE